jgi:hypothetical protein
MEIYYQLVCVRPSVRIQQVGSHWTDFFKFDILWFSENLLRKFKLH